MNNLSNSVRLTGRLGAAPQVKMLDEEKKVAKISLAMNYYRGDGKSETHWHQLVLWNKQADIAGKYLDKGSQIAIEGRLASRYYTDEDGARHQVTKVVVSKLMMFGMAS